MIVENSLDKTISNLHYFEQYDYILKSTLLDLY